MKPGVQKPHWVAPWWTKASCSGMQFRPSHAFDGQHLGTLGLERGVDARVHAAAVHDDRTRAALGLLAADLGPREAQVIAEHLGQEAVGGDFQGMGGAVDGDV